MKTEKKEKTIEVLDVMIQHADKGPSGFWVDDYEGCGNPQIFPEFEDGLKRGKLIQKEHYLCPWNTAVMYGNGHGNIYTGCYHSCSIEKAKFLSPEMLKSIENIPMDKSVLKQFLKAGFVFEHQWQNHKTDAY